MRLPLVQNFRNNTKVRSFIKIVFWFSSGALLGLFFFIITVFFFFQKNYSDKVYPGITIEGVDFGGKEKEEVRNYYDQKNSLSSGSQFVFESETVLATVSAKNLELGYDSQLLSQQAFSIGRSNNIISNITLVLDSYLNGVTLDPKYKYSEETYKNSLKPVIEKNTIEPVEALFTFANGRVTEFKASKEGQTVDEEKLKRDFESKIPDVVRNGQAQRIALQVPVKTIEPKLTTEKVNNLGIKELLGEGSSLFKGSIPERAYNISLAAGRINGILVKPGEIFSFNKALGDVSSFTGYKQAYIISGGKTILGDGGGVCQVSTTFFRALLNAGLPIVERHAHAYRVGYYEQDSDPGFDATIYVPTVDLKFKNDTNNHILITSFVDPTNQALTYRLYGTKDGREVTISQPVITGQTPAPEPKYEEDPNLPKGETKQIDFAAAGARVYFNRIVRKDGKVIIDETFSSNYRPWQAVFLRGTKEG